MLYYITNDYNKSDEIVQYLQGPRLWIPQNSYPDFTEWAERAHQQLTSNQKRAMVALEYGQVIGAIIYQKHKSLNSVEIKNITVRPDKRGRHLASFLLRNTEIEASTEYKTNSIILDTKSNNFQMINFLLQSHYKIQVKLNLYKNNIEDLVFTKQICKM